MQKGDRTGLPKAVKYICSFEMGMLQSVSEQRRGQVAVAGIRQQRYDGLAFVLRTLCKLDRSPDSRTGGNADPERPRAADQPAVAKASSFSTVMISS